MNLQLGLIEQLRKSYPSFVQLSDEYLRSKISENLICPFEIRLPHNLRIEMVRIAEAFAELRTRMSSEKLMFPNPGNLSIMSSLDFHVDEAGHLRLIEVNTNASFLIMGVEMYRLREIKAPFDFSAAKLADDIRNEMKLARISGEPKVAIVDEQPQEQRLFIEFLVAQAWAESAGLKAEICDVAEAGKTNFVYNRSTDFILQHPVSAALRKAWLEKQLCLSPNPFEYLLMADKQRLIDWSKPGGLDMLNLDTGTRSVLQKTFLKCKDLTSATPEELWADRKHLFFKPKREFGSKQAFRGASITRKVFNSMMTPEMMAQEYIPAPEVIFETPNGPQKFKYDLRCHIYNGEIRGLVARVYQGQVTNLKTEFGGFAPVVFEN